MRCVKIKRGRKKFTFHEWQSLFGIGPLMAATIVLAEGHVTISRPQLFLPSGFAGNDADRHFITRMVKPLGLPPLLVRGVGHVQDVTKGEGQAPRRHIIVARRVVIEEGADEQTPFFRHPEHGPRHDLVLQRVDFGLEFFVLFRPIRKDQL